MAEPNPLIELAWQVRTRATTPVLALEEARRVASLGADALAEAIRAVADLSNSDPALGVVLAELCREASGAVPVSEVSRAGLLINLAVCYTQAGAPAKAEEPVLEAVRLARSSGEASLELAALTSLGGVYLAMDRVAQASDCLRTATALGRQIDMTVHSVVALKLLGVCLRKEGKPEEALTAYLEAITAAKTSGPRGHLEETGLLGNCGNVLADLGRKEEALDYYRRGVEAARRDRVWQAGLKVALCWGQTLRECERPAEAAAAFETAAEFAADEPPKELLDAWVSAADSWQQADEPERQMACLKRALSLADRAGQDARLQVLNRLAVAYATRNEWDSVANTFMECARVHEALGNRISVTTDLSFAREARQLAGDMIGVLELTVRMVEEACAASGTEQLLAALGPMSSALPFVQRAATLLNDRRTPAEVVADLQADSTVGPESVGTTLLLLKSFVARNNRLAFWLGHFLNSTDWLLTDEQRLEIHEAHGITAQQLGDLDTARSQFTRGLDRARAAAHDASEIRLLNYLGILERTSGRTDEAIRALERAREILSTRPDRLGLGYVLGNLGTVYVELGNLSVARDLFCEALDQHRRDGDDAGEGLALTNLAEYHLRQGQAREAIPLLEQALTLLTKTDTPVHLAGAHANLAFAHMDGGDPAKARDHATIALSQLRQIGHEPNELILLLRMGQWLRTVGDFGSALRHLERAQSVAERLRDTRIGFLIAVEQGEIFLEDLKDFARADSAFDRALQFAVAVEGGSKRSEATVWLRLAEARAGLGRPDASAARTQATNALLAHWEQDRPTPPPPERAVWSCLLSLIGKEPPEAVKELLTTCGRAAVATTAVNSIEQWFKYNGLTGPFDVIRANLLTLSEKTVEPVPLASEDGTVEPADGIQMQSSDIVLSFIGFITQFDLGMGNTEGNALGFISNHPELLEDWVDSAFIHYLNVIPPRDKTYVAALYARSLITRCRQFGLKTISEQYIGAMLQPTDQGSRIVIAVDGQSAQFFLPEDQESEHFPDKLHVFLQPTTTVKLDQLDEDFPPAFLDWVSGLAAEARRQGALTVAARLSTIRPLLEHIQRLVALRSKLPDADLELFNRVTHLLGLPTRVDRQAVLTAQPDLIAPDTQEIVRRLLRAVEDEDWWRMAEAEYEEIVRGARKPESAPSRDPKATEVWLDDTFAAAPLYTLAREVASSQITWHEANERLAGIAATEAEMALPFIDSDLGRKHPSTAAYYFALAFRKSVGQDRAHRLYLAYFAALKAIDAGGASSAPVVSVLAEAAELVDESDGFSVTFVTEILLHRSFLLHGLDRSEEAAGAAERAAELIQCVPSLVTRAALLMSLGLRFEAVLLKEKAATCYMQAVTVAGAAGDQIEVANAQNLLGVLWYDSGAPGEALGSHLKALETYRKLEHKANVARTLDRIGSCYRQLRAPDLARESYQEALALRRELGDIGGEASTLANLGNVDRDLGDPAAGLAKYTRALELDPGAGVRIRANWVGNQGSAYFEMNQVDRAAEKWEEALVLQRQSGDVGMTGGWLMNLASVAQERGEIDGAVARAEEALGLLRCVRDRHKEAQALLLLSQVYDQTGQTDKTAEYLGEALAATREIGDRVGEACALHFRGRFAKRRGDTVAAVRDWEQALTLARGVAPALRAYLLTDLAEQYARAGDQGKSISLCKNAINTVERLRVQLPRPDQRLTFFRQFSRVYDQIVGTLVNLTFFDEAFRFCERMKTRTLSDMLAERDAVPADIPEELANRFRGVNRRVRHTLSAPESDEAARQLDLELDAVLAELRQHDPAFAAIQEGATVDLRSIRSCLRTDCVLVEFAVLKQGTVVFLVPGTGIRIPPAAATNTDKGQTDALRPRNEWVSDLGIQIVTLTEFTLDHLIDLLAAPETGWLRTYQAYVRERTPNALARMLDSLDGTLRALHSALIGPILEVLSRWGAVHELLIVPHRGLHLMPLDAAWAPDSDSVGVIPDRQYLQERYLVSYAPSATVWARPAPHQATSNQNLLMVENPTIAGNASGEGLAFVELEVEMIRRMMTGTQVRVLRQPEATKEAVATLASEYDHIHFACHGIYSQKPDESGLELTDGRLTTANIIRGDPLRPGCLVVLSACETGRTDPSDLMDEYISLASAFSYARAGSVLGTLWPVDDLSTSLLMEHFYAGLRSALRPEQALRNAQRTIREVRADELAVKFDQELGIAATNPTYMVLTLADAHRRFRSMSPETRPFRHPYYWAGFFLITQPTTEAVAGSGE